jgi:hypothetical protein
MSLIIGSSNVYRFYKPEVYTGVRKFSMVRCTDIASFKAIMSNLETDDKEVIVSVIENFLATAARSEETEEGRLESMGNVIEEFMKIVTSAATNYPDAKFAIAKPIWRPKFE